MPPEEVRTYAREKPACIWDLCGTCHRQNCSFPHGVTPSDAIKKVIAEWKQKSGKPGKGGGKGHGAKGADGGKGSREPTQAMFDIVKKVVAETGKKPACKFHKDGGCPFKGCPFWHSGRGAEGRASAIADPEDAFLGTWQENDFDYVESDSSESSS